MRRVALAVILVGSGFVGVACSGSSTTFGNAPTAAGENETPSIRPEGEEEEEGAEEEGAEGQPSDGGAKKDAGKDAGRADAGKKDASAPKDGGTIKSDASTGTGSCVGQGGVSGSAAGVTPSAQSA